MKKAQKVKIENLSKEIKQVLKGKLYLHHILCNSHDKQRCDRKSHYYIRWYLSQITMAGTLRVDTFLTTEHGASKSEAASEQQNAKNN